jgi:hypothetical protein
MAVAVVVGVAGITATAHAAQADPAEVLPPVAAPVATPAAGSSQPRNGPVSQAKPAAVVPTVSTSTATKAVPVAPIVPAAAATPRVATASAVPSVKAAAQSKPAEQADAVPISAPDLPPHVAAAAAVQSVNVASQSKPAEHADAIPIWAPDLPPHAAAQQPAVVAGAKATSASRMIYAAIPQNAPTATRPVNAHSVAPAALAQPAASPAPAQTVAAPAKAENPSALPAAPQPAAAPTALAAILPPSPAHADYLRIGGMTIGERMFEQDDYAATRDPSNWIVRIFKHNHRLEVYYRDNLYKGYHAVFGRSLWPGAKEVENDRRTPEGDYMIVQKHPSARFDWFLKINYPNAEDRAHFEELRDEGKIPAWAREGGQVGIHGTDNPILNVGDVNWTTGCISIDNGDIAELARLLPIGTVVIIRP